MAAGAGAIALSSVAGKEHGRWHDAAHREGRRYGVSADYVQAGLAGEDSNCEGAGNRARTWLDWTIVAIATTVFIGSAVASRVPDIALSSTATIVLSAILLVILAGCGVTLWKATRFS